MDHAVKFVDGHDDLIEGMLAPFGGPIAGKDLDGEFFDAETDFVLDWFGDWQRPSLFGHGFDPALKTSVVGRLKVEPTDKGLWAQAQLDRHHAYYEQVKQLIDDEALGWSSGSVDHLVQVNTKTGHIDRWPLIEGSLTPTPANPDALGVRYAGKSVDMLAHLAVLGVVAPAELEEEAITDDTETVIEAVKSVLTPQALHDASVASGAKCASENHAPPPVLAIAGKTVPDEPPFDLDDFNAELTRMAVAEAIKEAKTILG